MKSLLIICWLMILLSLANSELQKNVKGEAGLKTFGHLLLSLLKKEYGQCGVRMYGTSKRRDLRKSTVVELMTERLLHQHSASNGFSRSPSQSTVAPDLLDKLLRRVLKRKLTARILGGDYAEKGQFPWMVYFSFEGLQCGGSLINDQWVITAAHCFYQSNEYMTDLSKLLLFVGEVNIDTGTRLIPEKVVLHPKYSNSDNIYDIALIKLKEKVTFTEYVQPLCLPDAKIPADTLCTFAGWGATEGGEMRSELRFLEQVTLKQEDCSYYIEDWHVCAIAPSGSDDSCGGDSGGPLFCDVNGKFTVAGVLSYGDECDNKRSPAILTDVFYVKSWIDSTVN